MSQLRIPRSPRSRDVQYLRPPQRIHFPEAAEMPEGYAHLVARTFLFQLLRYALGSGHTVGSDQFVYWIASDPARKLSPDVFVRLDTPQTAFGSWKTWEQGGPPHLAVEIVSPNEGDGVPWEEKLARYHEAGIHELLRFDRQAEEGTRLRAWDRVEDDLVERRIADDRTPCLALGLGWTPFPLEPGVLGLRLVDDEGRLVETGQEAEARGRREEARGRQEEARGRQEEAAARAVAEARVRELEEELRRKS